jgi:lipoate-protein ligase A
MPNKRFNKQVPAFKAGGRAGKMGGGMMMKKPMMKVGGDVKKIEKTFKPKKKLKKVDAKKNPGLAKLPTKVRNKMGFMKKGGKVK